MSGGARRVRTYLQALLARPDAAPHAFRYADARFFLPFLKPVWKLGLGALLLLAAAAGLGALLPLSTKALVDFVVLHKEPQGVVRFLETLGLARFAAPVSAGLGSLNVVLAAVLAISLAAGALAVVQRYLMIRFEQALAFNLQAALLDRVLRFPLGLFREKQTGYLTARICDDVQSLQQVAVQRAAQFVTNLVRLVCGLVIAFSLSVKLALIALGLLPLYVLINVYFAGRVRSRARGVMESRALVAREVQQALSGIEVVKAFAAEDQEHRRIAERLRVLIADRIKAMMLTFLSGNLVMAVQVLSTFLMTWCGVREVLRGAMSVGDFVAFNSYLLYLSGPARTFSTFHLGLQPLFAALDRLLELFRLPVETDGAGAGWPRARLEPMRGAIEFRDVTFAYRAGHPVLQNVNLTVRSGEVVAVVGPSGAGKSTLMGLVLAFYRPDSGEILLDGRDLREFDPGWLRRQVGFVAQEGFLFEDTIRNNIRYGQPAATDEAVVAAARQANVHEDILKQPAGYETLAGERGVALSVGQKQRIALARVFLKDPPILILDEPASALDANAEALLKESLRTLIRGRTTFIVAHRFALIDCADSVVVLDGGRITGRGGHAELLRDCELYRTLHARQQHSARVHPGP